MSRADTSPAAARIVIVGGGRSGAAIARLFARDPAFAPEVLDIDYQRIRLLQAEGIAAREMSGDHKAGMMNVLKGAAAVICAAPPALVPRVAEFARETNCAYIDLCEDETAREAVAHIAEGASSTFVSGCGLAPGMLSLMIDDMVRGCGPDAELFAYVGVLPQTKSNRLGYGNMWDISGLLVEYTRPCTAISDGSVVSLPSLKGYERLIIGGSEYEAFHTSGALDHIVPSYVGRLKSLEFKTLRYPGHLDYMTFLLDDLGLSDRLYMVSQLLLNGLEKVERDRVIVHLVCRTQSEERSQTRLFEGGSSQFGAPESALARISAYHVCAVADVLTRGSVNSGGLLGHVDLPNGVLKQSAFFRAFVGEWKAGDEEG